MAHNYRVYVQYDAGRGAFVASAPELPRCLVEAPTRAEALALLEEEIDAQVATMRDQGRAAPIAVDEMSPAPEPAEGEPGAADAPRGRALDGRIAAKISPSLHRELLFHARAEGLPVDILVGELLAESLAWRSARELRPPRGPGRDRGRGDRGERDDRGNRARPDGRGRSDYGDVMEDKGSFLDYVRGLEQGRGDRGPRRQRGRGRGRGRGPDGGGIPGAG
jgi:predicted RNase H-like HicB family nuclease